MKQLKKLSLTLLLLITAVAGAWAEESETIVTTADKYTFTGEHFEIFCNFNDDGCALGYTTDAKVTITPLGNDIITKIEMVVGQVDGTIVSSSGTISGDNVAGGTLTLTGVETTPITLSRSGGNRYNYYTLTSFTIYYKKPLITVAADGKSATLNMPANDLSVNYTLVRDMQDQANPVAFVGLPNSGTIVVKKGSGGKYKPTDELDIRLIDPLAANNAQNIIAADGITVTVEKNSDNTWSAAGTFADFMADMQPGIAPNTQVKLNAKRGYVIEKVETKKNGALK